MELVNAIGKDLAPYPPMPAVYKMIATVMLQNVFEPSFRLGWNSQGIIERIQVPVKGSRYGLGYTPTDDYMNMKKINDQQLANTIPHLYQSFPVRVYADQDDLREGFYSLFEEIDVVIKNESRW